MEEFLKQFGSPATFVLMFLILAISYILMRSTRHYNRRKDDEPNWNRSAGTQKSPTKAELMRTDDSPARDRWEVEVYETARELQAKLNSKISILQTLIAEAERVAARLEAAKKTSSSAFEEIRLSGVSAETILRAKSGDQVNAESSEMPVNQAQALRASSSESAEHAMQQHGKIYALADSGLSGEEIAERLGMPIGEIELIIRLRDKG
jgi:hypothetical protein